jgi:hypothetical protein
LDAPGCHGHLNEKAMQLQLVLATSLVMVIFWTHLDATGHLDEKHMQFQLVMAMRAGRTWMPRAI